MLCSISFQSLRAIECDNENSEAYNTRAVALLYENDYTHTHLDLNKSIKYSQQFFIAYCKLIKPVDDSINAPAAAT